MRKVTFGDANSLDNYIAHPDGAVDWLKWGPGCLFVRYRVKK